MATRTVTSAIAGQPLARIGLNEKVMTYTQDMSSLTASDGDIILFSSAGKIPHGAVITDIQLRSDTTDGGIIYQAGFSGDAALFGSATASNVPVQRTFLGGTLPYTVSCSDDNATRYRILQLTQNGAGASLSGSLSLMVTVRYTWPKNG